VLFTRIIVTILAVSLLLFVTTASEVTRSVVRRLHPNWESEPLLRDDLVSPHLIDERRVARSGEQSYRKTFARKMRRSGGSVQGEHAAGRIATTESIPGASSSPPSYPAGYFAPSEYLVNLFRPISFLCWENVSAAVWMATVVVLIGVPLAIHVDLAVGYPGQGTALVAFTYPAIAMILSGMYVAQLAIAYASACGLYFFWCVVFGLARGMSNDMWSIDGGNLIAVLCAMAIGTVPYVLVATVVAAGRHLDLVDVRSQLLE